jgi:hypothetical protein
VCRGAVSSNRLNKYTSGSWESQDLFSRAGMVVHRLDYSCGGRGLAHNRTSMFRLLFYSLLALTVGSKMARADVVQPTVILPAPGGQYTVPAICVVTGCIVNSTLDNFVVTSSTESAGNQIEIVNADFGTDVYMNTGGSPGTLLGSVSLQGPVTFTYFGRDPSTNPLGTFNTQLSNFDFVGTLNGNTVEIRQSASTASLGTTTINQESMSPVSYGVSSTLTINGEISFNGSQFVPVTPVVTTLSPVSSVPEPGYTAAAGFLLLAVLGLKFRRQIQ